MTIEISIGAWVLLGATSLLFLGAGLTHAFRNRDEKTMRQIPWMEDVPIAQLRAIGSLEVLGALGLVLPLATGILPWLAPVAGVGLLSVMLAAAAFHLQRGEVKALPINLALGGLAAAAAGVAYAAL